MLALCLEKAEREGFSPNLYPQAMHELDVPRSYRTIIVCGSFGHRKYSSAGCAALRRFYEHLAPGGVLLMDLSMPYREGSWQWEFWLKKNREQGFGLGLVARW